jgi:hypothetical protein
LFETLAALPAGGGVVGRTKIADDNYPLPTDRLIFNYDQFGGTLLAPGGYDVYRFSIGGEMTAFDGMASAEIRVPFASTLDPVQSTSGITNRDTVFGDVHLTLKALVFNADDALVASGVGIAFPTAPDTVLRDVGGNDLLRVRNQSYIVTPYVGAAASPADGFFVQGWVQVSFDTTGCAVQAAPMGAPGLQTIGRVHDPALLQTDVQLGYWAYQSGGYGLAPFVELHYNRPFGAGESLAADGLLLTGAGTYNEFNLTLGATALVDSNLMVSAGLALPLRTAPDRTFDYQFGVRANWFFGPGVRGRGMIPMPIAPPG